MGITYQIGNDLNLDDVIELYKASTLGERRPVDNQTCMAGMLANANLVVAAWDNDLMVGISRTITDFHYCAYLSDLAVRESYQRKGIGKELIKRTQAELEPTASLILLAAPAAAEYYPHVGFESHPSAWILKSGQEIT
ncbi:MAG: putative N-acetyltransferase YhbS [Candidatus Latescibacterota bacterium]|jgi:predicted N-acetyltransferase YhbS